jgi:hypothetical protein
MVQILRDEKPRQEEPENQEEWKDCQHQVTRAKEGMLTRYVEARQSAGIWCPLCTQFFDPQRQPCASSQVSVLRSTEGVGDAEKGNPGGVVGVPADCRKFCGALWKI